MYRVKRTLEVIAVGLLLACSVPVVRAQVTTATVTGTVMDTTGAVVPGATVVLKNTENAVVRQETSGPDGSFHFQFVVVGRYELTVSHAGFRTEKMTALELNTSATVDLPIHLTVAQQTETVQVSGTDVAEIQTVTSDQESTLAASKLNTLPVQHQDWTTMLQLSTATIKPLSTSTAASTSPQGSGLNVNGLASVGYNLTVDGTNATSNPEFTAFNFYQASNVVNTVNNDAIAEVGFTKGIAPATVGNTLSSNVNLVTKSGTNQYHGSLYEINETADYDARNQFLTARRGKTFNEYGGSIGGYILKDKLFGFGSYEGARLSAQSPVSGTVPSPYLVANSPSVYAPIFAAFPTIAQPSNATALVGTYSGAGANRMKDGNGVVRIDYFLNPKNQLAVRYIRARPYDLIPAVVSSNPQVYAGHMDAVNVTHTYLGSRWTNNARFGFNQLKLNRINDAFWSGLPTLSYAGFTTGGVGAFYQHGNVTSYEDTAVYSVGKHTLQAGGILERVLAARFKFTTATISYSTATQWANNTPQSVLDSPNSFPSGTPLFAWTTWNYGGYVQDDYRASANLTLNLGIRYDYYTVPQEVNGRVFNRGISTTNPSLGWGFGAFRPANSMYDATYTNIEPRIGFAWVPPIDAKSVVRGGFGMFAVNHTIYGGPVDTYGLPGGEPMNFTISGSQLTAAATAGYGLSYPVAGSLTAYQTELAGLQTAGVLGTNLAFENVAGYFPDPNSIQYFLGVERTFPFDLAAKIHYINTRGLHMNQFETRNLPDRTTGVAPMSNFSSFYQFQAGDRSNFNGLEAELTKNLRHGVQLAANYTWSKALSYGDADILQPVEVQDNNNPAGDYGPAPFDIRQRLVVSGTWRLPKNLWLSANNRAVTTLLGGWEFGGIFTGQTGLPINITNSASSYPADRPNWASGPKYVPGYRKFGTGYVHQYINPCQPSTVIATCNNASQFAGNPAFTLAPMNTTVVAPYTAASNAQYLPGTLQRYSFYAPGYEDLDLSVKKAFALTEKSSLQLRMDAFDALNHTNLSGIVATFNGTSPSSVTGGTFGQLTTATPRTLQIGGRLEF
jgi:hypothetical protein